MRQAGWTVIFLGMFVVVLGELDLILTLNSGLPSVFWPALVIGLTLIGLGMLVVRMMAVGRRRRRLAE